MEGLFAYGLLIGVISLLFFFGLSTLEERFPKLKSSASLKWAQNISIWTLLICGLIVIIFFILAYLSQPSAFEKCMEDAKNMIDPKAIAWIEDYCASNQ